VKVLIKFHSDVSITPQYRNRGRVMRGTVLCVEDDRNLCQILAKALGGEGYRVLTAFDGDEAMAIIAEDPPDLVLLDLALQRRDGLAVLDSIRELPELRGRVPVVLLSSTSPTTEFRRHAMELGANDILVKPVPLYLLLASLEKQLGGIKDEIPVAAEESVEERRFAERAEGLEGSLNRLPFPALLHHLHGLRANGVLHLVYNKKRKWIEFSDGYPSAVRGNLVNETLGIMLVRGGRVTPAQAAESMRRMGHGQLQGEILVAMESLTEREMVLALRAQAEQKLFEIFSWESGNFRFEKDAHLQRANTLPVDVSPANIIVTGVRKRLHAKALTAFFDTNSSLFIAPAESSFYRFQDVELDDDQRSLLRQLNGTVRLSEYSGAEDSVRRTLYGLVAAGLLVLRRGEPVKERAIRPRLTDSSVDGIDSRSRAGDGALRAEFVGLLERFRDRNHFEILGVGEEAGEDEIAYAYSRLVELAHPDRVVHATDTSKRLAAQVYARVERAYEVLRDTRERQMYLLELKREAREDAENETAQRALEAESQFQRGEAALRQRNGDRALLCFGKALELYPEEGEYHAHYGYALHLCHPDNEPMTHEAMEHVKRGIKLAGHREKPYLFMGRLCKVLDRIEAAEKMFNRAAQIQPDCADALSELRLIEMRRRKAKGFIGRLFGR